MNSLILIFLFMNNTGPEHIEQNWIIEKDFDRTLQGWIVKDSQNNHYFVNCYLDAPIGFPFHPSLGKELKPYINSFVEVKSNFAMGRGGFLLYIYKLLILNLFYFL